MERVGAVNNSENTYFSKLIAVANSCHFFERVRTTIATSHQTRVELKSALP